MTAGRGPALVGSFVGRGLFACCGLLAGCGEPPPLPRGEAPPEGAFTLVVMPDTQGYVYGFEWDGALAAQVRWVAENAAAYDIRYLIHLGDIVNNNQTTQWQIVRGLFDVLHDGDAVKVPYSLVAGNHDLGMNGMAQSRWTLMTRDEYFGRNSPYGRQSTIGGFFEPDSTLNTWHEFKAGGKQWLIVALEFGPRDEVVAWADEVLAAHPDHRAIIVTHAYLYSSNARYQYVPYGGTQFANPHNYPFERDEDAMSDGEELWSRLVKKHANVRLVLSGHVVEDGEGRLTSVGDHGQVIHQLVQNFQPGVTDSEFGGSGYFRVMEFWPDGETVRVRTFSPYLGEYKLEPGHEFFLTLHDQQVGVDVAQAIQADAPLLYYRPQRGSAVNWNNARPELDGVYAGEGAGPWAFDGESAIHVGAPLPRLEKWTIEAWVRPTLRGSRQVLFTNDRPPVEVPAEADTDAPPTFEFHDDVLLGVAPEGTKFTEGVAWTIVHRDQTGLRTLAEATQRVLSDRWTHVVATGDGEKLRLYLDGALVTETITEGEDLALDGARALLGRSENISGAAYYGELGDVAIYDRALAAADVNRHRLAAFSRVTAARVEVAGTVDPDSEEYEGVTLAEQGIPGLSITQANRGDLQVFHGAAESRDPGTGYTGGVPLASGDGVLLATVAENSRAGVVGSVATSWNSWGEGIIGVSSTEVGASEQREVVDDDEEDTEADPATPSVKALYDVELRVLNEINIDVAMAWFPFRGGWRGGHLFADGTLIRGQGLTQAMIRPHPDATADDQRLLVDLDVDAGADGLLFAVGADGKNRVVSAAPRGDAPGWELRVQSNSVAREGLTRPSLAEALDKARVPPDERADVEETKVLTRDSLSLLYVPLDAVGLVGGVHDGVTGETRLAAGDFVMSALDEPGAYRLEVPGESPRTGMLILTAADVLDPRNVTLSYEDDGAGAFEIRAREVETAEPRATVFSWAFIKYNEPLELRR